MSLLVHSFHFSTKKISQRDLEEIVAHTLGKKRSELFFENLHFTKIEQDIIERLISRRELGEPLSLILGEVEFYGCKIELMNGVLIPRLESEFLVEHVLNKIGNVSGKLLLDLCCGTGCIGLAIKKHLNRLDVILSDISEFCTSLAEKNAKINNLDVTILTGDFLQPLKNKKIDYLVCNPPYISEKEYITLENSVKNYEPKLALVGGNDGLLFYRLLEKQVPLYLKQGGLLFLEIGSTQKNAIEKIFSSEMWSKKEFIKDLAGLDRFFFMQYQG